MKTSIILRKAKSSRDDKLIFVRFDEIDVCLEDLRFLILMEHENAFKRKHIERNNSLILYEWFKKPSE